MSKSSLFIYNAKERVVLFFLCIMIAAFTFTLGVHFGKRLAHRTGSLQSGTAHHVQTLPDQVPNHLEFSEQRKSADAAIQETLSEELKKEVELSQVRYHSDVQVDLPTHTKHLSGGATTLRNSDESPSTSTQKYTLQIGSFQSPEEAAVFQKHLQLIEPKPTLHEVEIEGKGKWYRLYVGRFLTRHAAEKAGEKYQSQHKFDSFIVQEL